MKPLLNYIFFDKNSAEIPPRYSLLDSREASGFEIDDLAGRSAIDVYYNVLNIIGERVKTGQVVRIKLIGCASSDESDRRPLARRRAENIGQYLSEIWDIPPQFIEIKATGLPENSSSERTPEGAEENRRVEIRIESGDMLSPPILSDFVYKSDVSQIAIAATTTIENYDRWEVRIAAGNLILYSNGGSGQIPDNIYLDMNEENIRQIKDFDALSFELIIDDSLAAEASARVETRVISADESRYQRFNLILFDFDSYVLNRRNTEVIDFINSRIKTGSNIVIEGFTDILGDEEYNRRLSELRAKTAAARINSTNIIIKAYGENQPLYDNDLPEGRFYNRTVRITAKSPE
jgi:outer membrane protein OmpA-like peptidoglycan-associated protein